jgi:endonuclease/exonuclease/phosphatase family metal-dependent hydrolase
MKPGGRKESGATLLTVAPFLDPRVRRKRLITATGNGALQWLARSVVALAVAGAVLCTLGSALGPERFGFLAEVQYLPYPVFLLPALAAVAISLMLGAAWRAASVLGLGLVATTVMGFELHAGDAGTHPIRVMTYNVKGYLVDDRVAGVALIAREIAQHDADIVVLQDSWELDWETPVPPEAIFGARHAYSIYSFREFVVASRYPMRECSVRHLSFREQSRAYLQCVVDARGVEIDVVTAHFISPRRALSSAREGQVAAIDEWRVNHEERMSQAETLAGDVRARRRPLILAGDLNAPQSSIVMRALLATGLRDAFSTAGKGYGYTWGHSLLAGLSFLRIDHILASPEIGVAECFVGGAQASPHRPVIADLYLKRHPA